MVLIKDPPEAEPPVKVTDELPVTVMFPALLTPLSA